MEEQKTQTTLDILGAVMHAQLWTFVSGFCVEHVFLPFHPHQYSVQKIAKEKAENRQTPK